MTKSRSLLKMRNVLDRNCRGKQNTHFMFSNFFFFRKSCRIGDNVKKKYCRARQETYDNMCWRIVWWITESTNTHSQCVIVIAFSLQQWLHERALILRRTYSACLVSLN